MKKQTGSYYTPKPLTDFITHYLFASKKQSFSSILEPSVGEGEFISSLMNNVSNINKIDITILDINQEALYQASDKITEKKEITKKIIVDDFLSFQKENKCKYSLIIGNPPYIKSGLLKKEQVKLCEKVHQQAGLKKCKINNIWTAFVISSSNMLNENGVLAFILPADLLQVKYAEEIRCFLEKNFNRLEIFIIDEPVFNQVDQQTVILFAFKKNIEKGTFFYSLKNIEKKQYKQISSNSLMINQSKWTHYNLTKREIKILNKLNNKLPKISDFIISRPGIVTAANNYFILSKSDVKKYKVEKLALPILQKSLFVKNNVIFSSKDFNDLVAEGKKTYLLSLTGNEKIHPELKELLKIGENNKINQRYKCIKRKNWYVIPNIVSSSVGWFFKRCHLYPKLVKNSANIRTTDAVYNIDMKNDYSIESFIYSFYNIVTLIFAELTGRKYGGGVLELTPKEFKYLPILYRNIDLSVFESLDYTLKNKHSVFDIFEHNKNIFNHLITQNEASLLPKIYKKLLDNRIKHTPRGNRCGKNIDIISPF
jgi:adenine-specific DNA-methyltransferase